MLKQCILRTIGNDRFPPVFPVHTGMTRPHRLKADGPLLGHKAARPEAPNCRHAAAIGHFAELDILSGATVRLELGRKRSVRSRLPLPVSRHRRAVRRRLTTGVSDTASKQHHPADSEAGAGLSEGPAGGSGGIVRASGEPRPCSGGSRRRTSLRDSAPRGRSPASGSRSAPTGAKRRRSARRSRSQGRHR